MRKLIILGAGWILIFLTLLFAPKLGQKMFPQPQIIKVEVPVYKEKIVEKPVYKGERIVEKEKIVYKPSNYHDLLVITKDTTDPSVYSMSFKKPVNIRQKGNSLIIKEE